MRTSLLVLTLFLSLCISFAHGEDVEVSIFVPESGLYGASDAEALLSLADLDCNGITPKMQPSYLQKVKAGTRVTGVELFDFSAELFSRPITISYDNGEKDTFLCPPKPNMVRRIYHFK